MIEIDYSRDKLLGDFSKKTLKDRYLLETETSPQQGLARMARHYCQGDYDFAQRIYDYASNLWFFPATPVLANAGTARGLPISCFLNYVPDSRKGLNDHWAENTFLSSMGGGIGGHWGDIRSDGASTSSGSKSTGSIPFLHVTDSQILAISQGVTRRGGYAAYTDISHPEIEEFLDMRKPTGGDPNRRNLNLHHGVNISDSFMDIILECANNPDADDAWKLVDPHSGNVTKEVSAKELWQKILINRVETGEPYLHFIDTTNRLRPDCLKELELDIKQSNLCSEITLPTNEDRTAVCCLSSVNLEYYDTWKDTNMVQDLIRFLDNVLQDFIDTAPDSLSKAKYSAERERSLGLGAMGFHAYLQKNMIPFDSGLAVSRTRAIFKSIRAEAEIATEELGREKDSAPDYIAGNTFSYQAELKPRRNVHLMAVAPNASSGIICGNTSPSVEPYAANAFTQKTQSGSNAFRNKFLDKIIRDRFPTDFEVENIWKDIISKGGSVQHLESSILSDEEKSVFKTAEELDQMWIIEHASHRQEFIDQSQSINLFFAGDVPKSYLHKVHLSAWQKGLKTLYYCRSKSVARPENIDTKLDRYQLKADDSECLSCEG